MRHLFSRKNLLRNPSLFLVATACCSLSTSSMRAIPADEAWAWCRARPSRSFGYAGRSADRDHRVFTARVRSVKPFRWRVSVASKNNRRGRPQPAIPTRRDPWLRQSDRACSACSAPFLSRISSPMPRSRSACLAAARILRPPRRRPRRLPPSRLPRLQFLRLPRLRQPDRRRFSP